MAAWGFRKRGLNVNFQLTLVSVPAHVEVAKVFPPLLPSNQEKGQHFTQLLNIALCMFVAEALQSVLAKKPEIGPFYRWLLSFLCFLLVLNTVCNEIDLGNIVIIVSG